MGKPRALDLFCGAGGVSVGLARAGYEVTGVDLNPKCEASWHRGMKPYGGAFVCADALTYPLKGYDLIHASPPCQAYSVAKNIHNSGHHHPRLIELVRERLRESGTRWVIENTPGAPLIHPATLCGLAFGLGVKRHRWFEASFPLIGTICPEGHPGDWVIVFGKKVLERSSQIGRTAQDGPIFCRLRLGTERGQEAMGIGWMTRAELSQAIPPAYAEYVGRQARGWLPEGAQIPLFHTFSQQS